MNLQGSRIFVEHASHAELYVRSGVLVAPLQSWRSDLANALSSSAMTGFCRRSRSRSNQGHEAGPELSSRYSGRVVSPPLVLNRWVGVALFAVDHVHDHSCDHLVRRLQMRVAQDQLVLDHLLVSVRPAKLSPSRQAVDQLNLKIACQVPQRPRRAPLKGVATRLMGYAEIAPRVAHDRGRQQQGLYARRRF